ncbi:HAMP domain-containing histidine kinase [Flavobacterium salilacus subsp. salilacus]|uniref:HAMP domain-containing sensor histidine kinase n=1 Tax=Flavobacterium TaxID=237 RepID=UPI001075367C|nr:MULTISPECIES: HAMP domain-containing sensor histidine kinase [Flavobacterium]KAF2518167.1 HAMP domain-containing histidine kinase [Flavobacterium salilacus subsp. salilacus]MBE1615522.1 HAMP domain-containing histidine kinase [Flavobacterium sp. SaA2.13]
MKIKTKIAITYVTLSVFSTLLLCIIVFYLFKQNNQYYFLKRLQDRAKIVASIHYQNDTIKAEYYRELKANGLEELIDEHEYVLKVNGNHNFEYNTKLQLPPEFYSEVMKNGKGWLEEDNEHFYGQIFDENGQKYMVIISAYDRRGNTSSIYITRIMLIGTACFVILAYFLGRFFARRVINPVSQITDEVNRISASNLHNRLSYNNNTDEIANLTRTFNDMLDRLETSFELQANFINNASHELKTPITTIIAETEIALLKERNPVEYIASLENINKQANRLGNLTESLLKLTQTGYDGKKQVQDIVRIDELLLDVKCDLDRLYPNNRVTIKLNDIPEDEHLLMLPCNRPLLELAIGNIISNGVKYSDNEEVFVSLSANRTKIKITITDIGIGIPPEDIPYLYEPFFRGKKASQYIGYGLGLPLAMKIIRMHNGDLTIKSEPEKGTVVNITFNKEQY